MKLNLTALYTDLYQLTMGQAYYLNNSHQKQVAFDYFFRKTPYEGGYVIFAGLSDFLDTLKTLRFSESDLSYLKSIGFDESYLEALKEFKFTGSIYALKEGDVVFPTTPILRVEGNMLETQLIETLLLNILNFESLIATKAARIRSVAEDKILSEFGLRRAQGLGSLLASRAAMIGGFNSTSNVFAAQKYGMETSGTMAHSFIQMHDSELEAFRKFAAANPKNVVLLVDTYDTLKSGVPNAIKVAKEMEEKGQKLQAIRLDSGDLSYLARKSRQQLDEAGLEYVKIAVSNQIDEYITRSLMHQKAPIDIFGIGTSLVTGNPDAALDGVYKIVMADGEPRIKLSENIQKTTLPGIKQVYRLIDAYGDFYGVDAITQVGESLPEQITDPFNAHKSLSCKGVKMEPLLHPIVENGTFLNYPTDVGEINKYSKSRLALLPPEFQRFENPHIYKVGMSNKTREIRNNLRDKYLKKDPNSF